MVIAPGDDRMLRDGGGGGGGGGRGYRESQEIFKTERGWSLEFQTRCTVMVWCGRGEDYDVSIVAGLIRGSRRGVVWRDLAVEILMEIELFVTQGFWDLKILFFTFLIILFRCNIHCIICNYVIVFAFTFWTYNKIKERNLYVLWEMKNYDDLSSGI